MGIFKKIKGRKYYKELAEKYRESYHREMDAKGRIFRENCRLLEEAAEHKAAKEEWIQKYHDLLMTRIELGENILKTIVEKGTTNDNT